MERNDIFRYEILSELERSPSVTNRIMTAKLGCSIKLTHALLKDLIGRGCIHVNKRNSRNWEYLLTPSGIAEKARLTMEFLDFTFGFYKEARRRSSQLCKDLAASGRRSVSFLGAGQLAEIAYLGVKEWGLDLRAVYGSGRESFLGISERPLSELPADRSSAILVCLYDPRSPMSSDYLPPGVDKLPSMEWIFKAPRLEARNLRKAREERPSC